MIIIKVNNNGAKGIEVDAVLKMLEFKKLAGDLDHVVIFSDETITEKSSVVLTGARANRAKYFLFPSKLRRHIKMDHYDYKNIKVGYVEHEGELFIIHRVKRNSFSSDK